MRFEIVSALFLALFVTIYAQDADASPKDTEGRIFLSTFTVILSTVTTTKTIGTTTTCTTSAAALSACSVGRRRRGLFYDETENNGLARRGLFFNDDESENKDGSISLPVKRFIFFIFFKAINSKIHRFLYIVLIFIPCKIDLLIHLTKLLSLQR
jgi:hypothetical protein